MMRTRPVTGGCGDVVALSPCTSQQCHSYSSTDTHNDVLMEHRQDISVVRLHDVISERRQMPQDDVTTTSHRRDSTTSQTSHKWNAQRRLSGTSPRRLSGTHPQCPISMSLRRLLKVPNETPNNVAVVRLHYILELRCRDALFVGLYYVFKLLGHDLHLVGFHVSFKYQIKHQIFLVPNKAETRRVVCNIHQQYTWKQLHTSTTLVIFFVQICACPGKKISSLTKEL